MPVSIREEGPADDAAVYRVVREAFAGAKHRDGTEQDLVVALRQGEAYIRELELVACLEDKLVGHILFTRAAIGEVPVLALAPLAVLPEAQRRGVGSALVREGHRRAAKMGFGYSVVLGDAAFYSRFGYVPASRFGIRAPFEVADEHFMAVRLRADVGELPGVVRYAAAFGL